jgi:hypothetical protein
MKRLFVSLACLLLILSAFGCGKKVEEKDTGAAGHPEEMADSTRLDSAATQMMDSAAKLVDTAMEEAAEAVEDAAEGAVEEVTGH